MLGGREPEEGVSPWRASAEWGKGDVFLFKRSYFLSWLPSLSKTGSTVGEPFLKPGRCPSWRPVQGKTTVLRISGAWVLIAQCWRGAEQEGLALHCCQGSWLALGTTQLTLHVYPATLQRCCWSCALGECSPWAPGARCRAAWPLCRQHCSGVRVQKTQHRWSSGGWWTCRHR